MSENMAPSPARPPCSVYIATSLDGYIAGPDHGLDWLTIVERPGEDYGYQAFFDGVDALVIGRKTYDVTLGFPSWPHGEKRCIVVTHAPPAAKHGEEFYSGPLLALVERLGAEGVRRIYVDGGTLIRASFAEDLIDEVTLSIVPVLLGAGVPLFGGIERRLTLVASRSFPSGLVQLHYSVDRAPA